MFAIARTNRQRTGTSLALALALMSGTALVATALEAPAFAQKKKKKDEESTSKTNYSKGFVAAYQPVEALSKADDHAGAKAQLQTVLAAIETDDDRNAAGGLAYNIGTDLGEPALQLQGIKMMLESGKLEQSRSGQFNFIGYQLALNEADYGAARSFLTGAIENQYSFEGRMSDGSTRTIGADDMRFMIAEVYFDEEDYPGGLSYIKRLVRERVASGGAVPQSWITRALTVAYNNDQAGAAVEFGLMFVEYFPSEQSWGDAIAIQRNLIDYDGHATLDLLRLAMRTNSLRDERSYVDYIEAADARRLPAGVQKVIDAGVAAGKLKANDVFVADAKQIASSRIAADRADLPALDRDARAASATAVTAMGAGDAFLSHGQPAKAEEFYQIALTKPGVDAPRVLTRLGIVQADQGKSAEAIATLAKVEGVRKPIAMLWSLYAEQKAAPAPAPVVAATDSN